jgi:hypothetical protein
MHVSVQKFISTTWPRSSAGPGGSELSHAVAAPSEGMCRQPFEDHHLVGLLGTFDRKWHQAAIW